MTRDPLITWLPLIEASPIFTVINKTVLEYRDFIQLLFLVTLSALEQRKLNLNPSRNKLTTKNLLLSHIPEEPFRFMVQKVRFISFHDSSYQGVKFLKI